MKLLTKLIAGWWVFLVATGTGILAFDLVRDRAGLAIIGLLTAIFGTVAIIVAEDS